MVEEEDNKKVLIHCASVDLLSYSPKISSERSNGGIITWGDKNKLPSFLYDLYENSHTLQSVVNGISDYTIGAGIENRTTFTGKNEYGDTLETVVYKTILDKNIFGGAFIQVKKTFNGNISVAHIDPRKCRLSCDEKVVHVSNAFAFSHWNTKNCTQYNIFNPDTIMEDGVQIYYDRGCRTRGTYPVCDYKSALASCEIEIESDKFDYNSIANGMSVQGILNIAGDVPEAARESILHDVVKMYTGAEKAGRILTTFTGIGENRTPVTFTPIISNDADTRFTNAVSRAETNIFTAWRANPICFGLNVKTGFADQNFEEAYDLLYLTHIVKKRSEVKTIFGEIFGNEEAIEFINIDFGQTIKEAENEA